MKRNEPLQFVGKMCAPFRLADGEGLLLTIVSLRQMINANDHGTELFAIGNHATDRNATKSNAMITALITLVVYVLVIIFCLLAAQLSVDAIPLPAPFNRIAKVVLLVVAVLIVILLLLQFAGVMDGGLPKLGRL